MIAAKTIDKEISMYLEHLNNGQKEAVLKVIKTFAHEEDEWWEALESDAKDSITKGLKQAKEGEVVPHNEVMKKYRRWQSK
ncbi:MAG: hypothetical protein IAE95_05685 [Chitinophagaceae bacterium]|nr:hypothetical protein [Chitinophagaceae bacterium]